jgi:hypothetical protein
MPGRNCVGESETGVAPPPHDVAFLPPGVVRTKTGVVREKTSVMRMKYGVMPRQTGVMFGKNDSVRTGNNLVFGKKAVFLTF